MEFQNYGTNSKLDKLVDHEDPIVRVAVAELCYGLDKLVNDDHWAVRIAVAEQRYGLDKLVHDEIWSVREAVAKQGYGLDTLVHDVSSRVHDAALNKLSELKIGEEMINYGTIQELDKLVDHENPIIRRSIAEQGYGLDKLVNDKDLWVSSIAKNML